MPQDYTGGWEQAYENQREDLKCGDDADETAAPKPCTCECHSEYDWYPVGSTSTTSGVSPYYWDHDAGKMRHIIGPVQQVWKGNPYCCMDCDPPSPLDFF